MNTPITPTAQAVEAAVQRIMCLADGYVLHFDKPFSAEVGAQHRNALETALRAELARPQEVARYAIPVGVRELIGDVADDTSLNDELRNWAKRLLAQYPVSGSQEVAEVTDADDLTEAESVSACLGDDAYALRIADPANEEIADNMERAAALLDQYRAASRVPVALGARSQGDSVHLAVAETRGVQGAEPVAWRMRYEEHPGGWSDWLVLSMEPRARASLKTQIEPLYTAPAGTVPLSQGNRDQGHLAVAESGPVQAWRHVANEWADMATNGIQYVKNIRDGITTCEEALAGLAANLEHCRSVERPPLAAQPTTPAPGPVAQGEAIQDSFHSANADSGRVQGVEPVAPHPASTGRVSEYEATMRLQWLKDLVRKQQQRYADQCSRDPDTDDWTCPEWVDAAYEELDDLYEVAEKSKGFRFADTWCSQCGTKFGPGDGGYSSCADHATPAAVGGEIQKRWAVFCDTCGKTWSIVALHHKDKDRCLTCRAAPQKAVAATPAVVQPTPEAQGMDAKDASPEKNSFHLDSGATCRVQAQGPTDAIERMQTEHIREDRTVEGWFVETHYTPCKGVMDADGYMRVLVDEEGYDTETRILHATLNSIGWVLSSATPSGQGVGS